jgi:hypothetical protein
VDSTTQEGSGRDHDRSRREPTTLQCLDPLDAPTCLIENEASDRSLDAMQRRMLLEEHAHGSAIDSAVTLCTRRPNSRTLPAIEHSELQRRDIGRSAHDAA